LYNYADKSYDWIPCQVVYKVHLLKDTVNRLNTSSFPVDAYAVKFDKLSNDLVLKTSSEIVINDQNIINKLELRFVDVMK